MMLNKNILWRIRYNSIRFMKDTIICMYYNIFKQKTFSFNGHIYHYFYHKYNRTWTNERTVEVPIVKQILDKYGGKNILEVGNVLSNYFPIDHCVLDKYDESLGVINEDVIHFTTSKKFDLIVSISTLEHVGWDEDIKNPDKILLAIDNLKMCLKSDGILIVTMPLGYNPYLDKLIKECKIELTHEYYMKRVSADNVWIEIKKNDVNVNDIKFDEPYVYANGIIIGIIK